MTANESNPAEGQEPNGTDDTITNPLGEADFRFHGYGYGGVVGYGIRHVELDNGETQIVRLTFDLGGLEMNTDFSIEEAEEFIVAYRDAVVRAKQARLEWETNTDPESGIAE